MEAALYRMVGGGGGLCGAVVVFLCGLVMRVKGKDFFLFFILFFGGGRFCVCGEKKRTFWGRSKKEKKNQQGRICL